MLHHRMRRVVAGGGKTYSPKSLILDCAENYGFATVMALRSLDLNLRGSLIDITAGQISVFATTKFDADHDEEHIFITALSKTGLWINNGWVSNGVKQPNRISVVFNDIPTFDEIVMNNGHNEGGLTDAGVKGLEIFTSSDSISSTTYGGAISNSELIFNSDLTEHVALDEIDNETLILI